jgi:hypothetical protein
MRIEGPCLPKGELCPNGDGDCCGRWCVGNPAHCAGTTDEPCLALGELCTGDGGDGGCCSGLCTDGRCSSVQSCLADLEPCALASECCGERCENFGVTTRTRCAGEKVNRDN